MRRTLRGRVGVESVVRMKTEVMLIPLDVMLEAVIGYVLAILGVIGKYAQFNDVLDLRKEKRS